MKKYSQSIVVLSLFLGLSAKAQVAIGKQAVTNSSVSLEFETEARGIIMPWVEKETSVTNAVDGTIIFDVETKDLKVKENGNWVNFTDGSAGQVDTTLQNGLTEKTDAKVSIGVPAVPAVPGILVLEDANKAMILPKTDSPHSSIVSPEPGTIVFDTVKQQVAVFDGTKWSFWN